MVTLWRIEGARGLQTARVYFLKWTKELAQREITLVSRIPDVSQVQASMKTMQRLGVGVEVKGGTKQTRLTKLTFLHQKASFQLWHST